MRRRLLSDKRAGFARTARAAWKCVSFRAAGIAMLAIRLFEKSDMLTHCIAVLGAAGIGATIGVKIWFALRHADAGAAPDRPASFARMRRPAPAPCTRRRTPKTTRASARH